MSVGSHAPRAVGVHCVRPDPGSGVFLFTLFGFRHRSCGVPTTSGQAYCSDECRSQDEVAPSPMTSPAPSVVPPLVPSRGRGHKSDSSGTSPPSSLGIDEDEDEDEMERFYLPPPVGAGSYADASTRRPSSASKKPVPFNYQLSPIFRRRRRRTLARVGSPDSPVLPARSSTARSRGGTVCSADHTWLIALTPGTICIEITANQLLQSDHPWPVRKRMECCRPSSIPFRAVARPLHQLQARHPPLPAPSGSTAMEQHHPHSLRPKS